MKRTTFAFSFFLLNIIVSSILIFTNISDTQAQHKPMYPE